MGIHSLAATTWQNMLQALQGMIDKAAAHADADTMMDARLAEDMHPLSTQFRFVANQPGEALVRLAGLEFTSSDEDPATLAEAKERLTKTQELVGSVKLESYLPADHTFDMTIPNGMTFHLTAADYLRDWHLPNFYFHTSIAYAIMRSRGVELGKADLIPHMARHFKAG